MVCQLTGMDVANASLYDGSTAVVEAALHGGRPRRRRGEVLVSRALDPQYRATLQTYANGARLHHARDWPGGRRHVGRRAGGGDDHETTAVIIQQPNFFGALEDVRGIETAGRTRARRV